MDAMKEGRPVPAKNHSESRDNRADKTLVLVTPKRQLRGVTQALVTAFSKRGYCVKTVPDGQANLAECDIMILIGSVGALRKTVSALRAAKEKRPIVIVWGNEPLPPEGMKPWAIKLGIALSLTAVHVTKSKPIWHLINFPAYFAISRLGLGIYSRADNAAGVFTALVRFAFDNLGLIVIGVRENWIDIVCVTTMQRCNLLTELGLDPVFASVGQQEGFGHDLGLHRDIDVLFIGRIKKNKDRARRTDRLLQEIRARNHTVEIHTQGLYGDRRTEILNRTKIVLNLRNFPWDTPWMRWFLADANGALMVSEPLSVPEPLVPGQHYLSGPMEELPDIIDDVLADEDRRLRMVASCRERINETMTLDVSVERILSSLQGKLKKAHSDA